jgi:hypothetical protein
MLPHALMLNQGQRFGGKPMHSRPTAHQLLQGVFRLMVRGFFSRTIRAQRSFLNLSREQLPRQCARQAHHQYPTDVPTFKSQT